jgi:DNA primase
VLTGNMRITFTNDTEHRLTEINIAGCETESIAKLEPNESKTVWVRITRDCFIHVDYKESGKQRSENVAGYVTRGMEQKTNYKIDGENHSKF